MATPAVPAPTTADLGRARFPDAGFDAPDGTPIRFDTDLLGRSRPGALGTTDALPAQDVFDPSLGGLVEVDR